MDDVAGCRLIFRSIRALNKFRNEFHRARFNHRLRHEPDKYDYIKRPKETGYRGIHDVYEYHVNSEAGRNLAGLYIEIQYRTFVQHAWATAVEVIGFITESQPKSQEGDKRYETAMAYASEMLARAHEGERGPFPTLSNRELLARFVQLDEELSLIKTLSGLNRAKSDVKSKGNAILIFSKSGDLEIRHFRDAPEALRVLFDLEQKLPERDIVLVRADTSEEVRTAFRNYFNDAEEFVELVEQACATLSDQPRFKRRARRGSAK